MVFNISGHKKLFTPVFIEKLRMGDRDALADLYRLPKIGYIGKRGQLRGNWAFDHPKLFVENHIYFELLKQQQRLLGSVGQDGDLASSSLMDTSSSSRKKWESTAKKSILNHSNSKRRKLPSGEKVRCMNQDFEVKHARRIFRDFTLFARIKALVNFANDPLAVEHMRILLPESQKEQAERLVHEAVMGGWEKIAQMIQKRTAYKASEEPNWTKRGYNTVEAGSIVDGLLEQLGAEAQTEGARALRDAVMQAKHKAAKPGFLARWLRS